VIEQLLDLRPGQLDGVFELDPVEREHERTAQRGEHLRTAQLCTRPSLLEAIRIHALRCIRVEHEALPDDDAFLAR
jgi:hypothetical protein